MNESDLPDDDSIPDSVQLWRRIPSWHIVADENRQTLRIASAAFDDSADGSAMSVFHGEQVRESGRAPEALLVGFEGFGLAWFRRGLARELNQKVAPTPELGDPAHLSVIGKKSRSVMRKLAGAAKWIIRNPERAILDHFVKNKPHWLWMLNERGPHDILEPKD